MTHPTDPTDPTRTAPPVERLARWLRRSGVVVTALVGLVAVVRMLPVAVVEDLGLTDDATVYLHRGRWPHGVDGPGAWSPVFGAWYRLAGFLLGDPVRVQFSTYLLFGVALGLTVLALAVALGARRGPAALAALAVTATALPTVRPTVGTVAAVVRWTTVAAVWRWRRRPAFWPILTVGVALATWTRPEFVVALVAVTGLSVAAAVVGRRVVDRRSRRLAAVACVLVAGVAWLAAGSPVAGNRQWIAFCQHEGYARSILGDTGPDPWGAWEETCRATYGTDASITVAAVNHPGAVAAHVGRSLRLAPASLRDALLQQPGRAGRVRSGVAVAVGAGLVGAAVVVGVRRRREIIPRIRAAGLPGVALGVLLLPSLAAIVVVHPRFHHLAVPTVAVMAGAAVVVRWARARWSAAVVVAGCALLAVVVTGTAVLQASAPPPRPMLRLVTELRRRVDGADLHRITPVVFDLTGYLPGVEPVPFPEGVGAAFPDWLRRQRIDAVLAPATTSVDRAQVSSPAVGSFLDHPDRFGWRAATLGGDAVLYVPVGADG